jgi:hypothetical protein
MKNLTFATNVFVCAWLALLPLSPANAQTQAQKSTPTIKPSDSSPIAGQWRWKQFDGSCSETLRYQSNGELMAISGKSISQWTYQISKSPNAAGFYRVLETLMNDNGEPDCTGNLPTDMGLSIDRNIAAELRAKTALKPGETVARQDRTRSRFMQLSPAGNLLLVCSAESLKACFGPLTKEPGQNW